MRTVRATRFVECPFSAVIEFAEAALRERRDITVSPAPGPGEPVHVNYQTADDVSDSIRRHDALLLAWTPEHATFFPRFHGVLTVRPKGRGTSLRSQGSYEPPFGGAGRAFDAVAGHIIAQITIARFLDSIAQAVERRWRAFREELPV